MTLLKELDDNIRCTMTLLPVSAHETEVRCDIYVDKDIEMAKNAAEKWKMATRKEIACIGADAMNGESSLSSFTYECGGMRLC